MTLENYLLSSSSFIEPCTIPGNSHGHLFLVFPIFGLFFQLSEFHPSYLLQAIHLYGTRSSSSPNTSYFSYHYVAFHRNYHYSNFSKSILFRMSTLSKTVVLNLGLIEPQGYSESVPRVRQFCSLSSDPLCR